MRVAPPIQVLLLLVLTAFPPGLLSPVPPLILPNPLNTDILFTRVSLFTGLGGFEDQHTINRKYRLSACSYLYSVIAINNTPLSPSRWLRVLPRRHLQVIPSPPQGLWILAVALPSPPQGSWMSLTCLGP